MKRSGQSKTITKTNGQAPTQQSQKEIIRNSEIFSPGRPARRRYTYKSEETRLSAQKHLKPWVKGQPSPNPEGRGKHKPFHDAAMLLAEDLVGNLNPRSKNNAMHIKSTDTVATAVMKSLAASALSFGPQKVSAAKEFADRAEGPPDKIVLEDAVGDVRIQRGISDLVVRFGIQFEVSPSEPTS